MSSERGSAIAEHPREESKINMNESEMITHLFESTILFFRLVNNAMIKLGWNRTKRKQVFESIIRRSSVDSKDLIEGLVEELKPLFTEISQRSKSVSDLPPTI